MMATIARIAIGCLRVVQFALAVRVIPRLVRTAGGRPVVTSVATPAGAISVIVPVLNEEARLGPCLAGLAMQGPVVAEILVVDGGSTDGTAAIVAACTDPRIRLIDASPVPDDWNGKAWGLEVGRRAASAPWLLTIDADVRPAPLLASSLLAHALGDKLDLVSVATDQTLSGPAEALIHPAMLTTLVYRFGLPGRVARGLGDVQANGQCMLIREIGDGFAAVRASRCEDVTLARRFVAQGRRVAFVETDRLVAVAMFGSAGDAWRNWPRSLPLNDQYDAGWLSLAEVVFVQVLPLVALLLRAVRWTVPSLGGAGVSPVQGGRYGGASEEPPLDQRWTGGTPASRSQRPVVLVGQTPQGRPYPRRLPYEYNGAVHAGHALGGLGGQGRPPHAVPAWPIVVANDSGNDAVIRGGERFVDRVNLVLDLALLMVRVGVLAGTARAYRRRPWTYWLSPLLDGPVAARIVASRLQRRHRWRGRDLRLGGSR